MSPYQERRPFPPAVLVRLEPARPVLVTGPVRWADRPGALRCAAMRPLFAMLMNRRMPAQERS
ncbi:MAG: hypothetical protein DMF50_00090 [Acidobacteria bacterium]|nr:MAG: hypothetical protein DMF50_00090 [Acidobacteriota bacterium]